MRTLKEFCGALALRYHVCHHTAWHWVRRTDRFIGFRVRKIQSNAAIVIGEARVNPRSAHWPRPGERTFKEFCADEADRLGVGPHAVQNRFYRGKYPEVKVRRANPGVVFVRTARRSVPT